MGSRSNEAKHSSGFFANAAANERSTWRNGWGGTLSWRLSSSFDEVTRDPNRWSYTDLAIAPPQEDELDTLDLYHATSGGEAALARQRRHDAIRDRAEAARPDAAVASGAAD